MTFTPSLGRVLHWRIHSRDYHEQTLLVAIVEKLIDMLDAEAA